MARPPGSRNVIQKEKKVRQVNALKGFTKAYERVSDFEKRLALAFKTKKR